MKDYLEENNHKLLKVYAGVIGDWWKGLNEKYIWIDVPIKILGLGEMIYVTTLYNS